MNKLETLEPELKPLIEQLIMGAEIATGLEWIVTSGRRTMAEQQKLYDQGRTTKGAIVTKAKPGQSAHNFGLAADLAPMKDGKIWWSAPESVWQAMADTAVKLGLTAGFYFKSFKDMPHTQVANFDSIRNNWIAAGKPLKNGEPDVQNV